jgi:hypothetical protein
VLEAVDVDVHRRRRSDRDPAGDLIAGVVDRERPPADVEPVGRRVRIITDRYVGAQRDVLEVHLATLDLREADADLAVQVDHRVGARVVERRGYGVAQLGEIELGEERQVGVELELVR